MRYVWFCVLAAGSALTGCQKSAPDPTSLSAAPKDVQSRGADSQRESANKAQNMAPSQTTSSAQPFSGAHTVAKVPVEEPPVPGEEKGAPTAKTSQTYMATLSGSNLVPPVKTKAAGEVKLQVNKSGKQIHFALTIHDLKDATMAHLHMATAGKNGPVIVWLYPPGKQEPKQKEGVTNGTLSDGTITTAEFIGPLKGKPFSDLIKAISEGDVCVIVHTTEHPAGELRGQVH